MQCPFCLQEVREVGAIALLTPAQVAETSAQPPIVGTPCINCLGLLSIVLDSLAQGRIRQLADRWLSNGAIRRQ